MTTEDYVSFEVAKLLSKNGFGFPEDCFTYYTLHGIVCEKGRSDEVGIASRPTLQMAMKWLRETFGIHCQIDCPIAASNWVYGIRDLNKDEWVTLRNMGDYDTYEEACEAAIKYVLENLI